MITSSRLAPLARSWVIGTSSPTWWLLKEMYLCHPHFLQSPPPQWISAGLVLDSSHGGTFCARAGNAVNKEFCLSLNSG